MHCWIPRVQRKGYTRPAFESLSEFRRHFCHLPRCRIAAIYDLVILSTCLAPVCRGMAPTLPAVAMRIAWSTKLSRMQFQSQNCATSSFCSRWLRSHTAMCHASAGTKPCKRKARYACLSHAHQHLQKSFCQFSDIECRHLQELVQEFGYQEVDNSLSAMSDVQKIGIFTAAGQCWASAPSWPSGLKL